MIRQLFWPIESVSDSSRLIDVCEWVYFPRSLSIRSEDTRRQYRMAIDSYSEFLGKIALVSDLDDDMIIMFLKAEVDIHQNSPATANGKAGRIKSLWNWLSKKGCVKKWPTFTLLPRPFRSPKAWRELELRKLYDACCNKRGSFCGVPKGIWWSTLICFIWNTGERIGAVKALNWDNFCFDERWVSVPCEVRKGRVVERGYRLWPETIELLLKLKKYTPGKAVFPFPFSNGTLYNHYKKILQNANLPTDRKSKFHCIRVSHATWVKVIGGNPQEALGHSSMEVTKRSYLDPSIIQVEAPDLFRLKPKPSVEPTDIGRDDHLPLDEH